MSAPTTHVESNKVVEFPATSSDTIPFPTTAIVGLGKSFVNLYENKLESPPEFLFTAWETCFSLAIAPHIRLKLTIYSKPRLHSVMLGESAWSRKSTGNNKAIEFWDGIGDNFIRTGDDEPLIRVVHGLGSVEGFALSFNGNVKTKKDGTESGLVADRRPTLVHYDELSAFVCKAKQKGSQLLPFLSQMFESENYDNDTVGNRVHLEGCHIGLLAATTRDTYDNMWSEEFTSIGLLNRLWLTLGHKTNSVALPEPPAATALDQLRADVRQLLGKIRRWSGEHIEGMTLSPSAAKLWKDYYPEIEKGGVHSKRLDSYGFKWMTLLALSRGEFQVDRDAVEQTIKLLDYQLAVRKLCSPIEADSAVAKMEEKLRRLFERCKEWSVREIQQYANVKRAGFWVLEAALNNLVKSGEIRSIGAKRYAWTEA